MLKKVLKTSIIPRATQNNMPHTQGHKHHILNRELSELFATVSIRGFAVSLIAIFIPIYLLEIGYSLSMTLLFFVVTNVFHFLGIYPAALIISKKGVKHTIFYSMPFLILFFLGL